MTSEIHENLTACITLVVFSSHRDPLQRREDIQRNVK